MQPIEDYIKQFSDALKTMQKLTPTVDSVNSLISEEEQFEFVKLFRELLRTKNILVTFADFSFETLGIDEQTFEDYKSKYLDIYDKVRNENEKEKVSILDDVDFELELIRRDEINIDYILNLLSNLSDAPESKQAEQKKAILDLVS
jgi:type I restriction enzyme R subunit